MSGAAVPSVACERPCPATHSCPTRRTLYQANGQFMTDNLNDWQHSAMCEFGAEAGGAVDVRLAAEILRRRGLSRGGTLRGASTPRQNAHPIPALPPACRHMLHRQRPG